jgi:hypothetical protein
VAGARQNEVAERDTADARAVIPQLSHYPPGSLRDPGSGQRVRSPAAGSFGRGEAYTARPTATRVPVASRISTSATLTVRPTRSVRPTLKTVYCTHPIRAQA